MSLILKSNASTQLDTMVTIFKCVLFLFEVSNWPGHHDHRHTHVYDHGYKKKLPVTNGFQLECALLYEVDAITLWAKRTLRYVGLDGVNCEKSFGGIAGQNKLLI